MTWCEKETLDLDQTRGGVWLRTPDTNHNQEALSRRKLLACTIKCDIAVKPFPEFCINLRYLPFSGLI